MDNPIAVCVDRNPFGTVDELVELTVRTGLDCIEWFEVGTEDAPPWSAPENAAHIRTLMRRHELMCQFHAPYEGVFDLGREGDGPRRPESVARLITVFAEKAERLGARLTTIHLGSCPRGADRTDVMRNVMQGIRLATPELERHRMRLALENHTSAIITDTLGDRPEDLDWLAENIQSEWVGFTLDIGHAHINGHLDAFLARPFDRVFNFHIHDNDGKEDKHLPVGHGTVPWGRVLPQIAHKCYHGPLTLEFFGRPEDYTRAIADIRRCN